MRTVLPGLLLILAACAHAPASAPAVPVESVPARPEDVSTIDGLMDAFYAVVNVAPEEPRQWARDRTLFAPWIRFVAIGPTVQVFDHHAFVEDTEPLLRAGFRERELRRIVRRYGNIAQVESSYETFMGRDASQRSRGVNYVQLYFDGHRWWVTSAVWQKEDAANPIPPQLLPSDER
ncbi:transformer-2 protein homolog alpha/beta [Pyxidicoccus xibeiensis]|uniref:transformer-2 protein homolog alpha/beta n=1 Tax=Pyxidicoccus xibeiensis TaxID=2906759 RepID=UPI0020A7455B|nr:transformer-2 protein homolog alpha/beta [Pyxidicoccus xibeiensis]MCP3141843.1 transformer-2 protein homolog alpha/beta [Pyxidicoccus xibeiensis]